MITHINLIGFLFKSPPFLFEAKKQHLILMLTFKIYPAL